LSSPRKPHAHGPFQFPDRLLDFHLFSCPVHDFMDAGLIVF
jgi:hypothetical protein